MRTLVFLAALVEVPARAGSLHALEYGDATAVVNQLLTALAEDPRSNRLVLGGDSEKLRDCLLPGPYADLRPDCRKSLAELPPVNVLFPPMQKQLRLQRKQDYGADLQLFCKDFKLILILHEE